MVLIPFETVTVLGQTPQALKGRPARPTKTPFVGPVIVGHQEVGLVTHYGPQAAHFARNGQKATAQLVRLLTRQGPVFNPHRIRGVRVSTEAATATITELSLATDHDEGQNQGYSTSETTQLSQVRSILARVEVARPVIAVLLSTVVEILSTSQKMD